MCVSVRFEVLWVRRITGLELEGLIEKWKGQSFGFHFIISNKKKERGCKRKKRKEKEREETLGMEERREPHLSE